MRACIGMCACVCASYDRRWVSCVLACVCVYAYVSVFMCMCVFLESRLHNRYWGGQQQGMNVRAATRERCAGSNKGMNDKQLCGRHLFLKCVGDKKGVYNCVGSKSVDAREGSYIYLLLRVCVRAWGGACGCVGGTHTHTRTYTFVAVGRLGTKWLCLGLALTHTHTHTQTHTHTHAHTCTHVWQV